MLKNQSRTDSRPYEAAGRYHNDSQAAAMFAMNEKKASAYLRATSRDVREKVDYIAALCMRAYTPLPGDRQLVGWLASTRWMLITLRHGVKVEQLPRRIARCSVKHTTVLKGIDSLCQIALDTAILWG